ncbi:MAG: 16S rRNA (uracil(1498)-N(3))-methyltransferase [Spirochaetaceae bacterium]|nr:16S rRNA (uracil(1498)-N(3))-methyltransferase [Spirochaetaceae bacterium]
MRQVLLSGNVPITDKIEITGEDFHHLCHVRRIKVGEKIKVAADSGKVGIFQVVRITSDAAILEKQWDEVKEQPGLVFMDDLPVGFGCEIYLIQLMPKTVRFEQILRQGTEIGVSRILPVISQYSPTEQVSSSKKIRFQKIIKEARQQSGSMIQTTVDDEMDLAQSIRIAKERGEKYGKENCAFFTLSERGGSLLHEKLCVKKKFIAVVIGCEGGFSDGEYNLLIENNFEPINFETNIMRVETAAIFGIAAIQTKNLEL